jgi:hypothetical protein
MNVQGIDDKDTEGKSHMITSALNLFTQARPIPENPLVNRFFI